MPIWDTFMDWAKQVQTLGVHHAKSREALSYLIKHEAGLRRYCEDGRLPISNILTEHVAKSVAIARRNFLFADTSAGAASSALIFSVLESARANNHNPLHYMTVVLAAMPNATSIEGIEALLPWQLSPQQAAKLYHSQPSPAQKIPAWFFSGQYWAGWIAYRCVRYSRCCDRSATDLLRVHGS